MRFIFEDGKRLKLGPLTPYQKPRLLMLFLLVPIVACITLTWITFNYMFVANQVKENEHGATAVRHETIETAVTAHELSLELNDALTEFDKAAHEYFGRRHSWTKDGARFTPPYIDDFVRAKGDLGLLREYFDLSKARVEFDAKVAGLYAEIDSTIASLPQDATREKVLQAQRLTRVEIDRMAQELAYQREALNEFGTKFRDFVKEQDHEAQ